MQTVEQFLEEGDELNHCVFTNEYYKKANSLLLSAQIENRPVETIEVSLSEMKIAQSRGKGNKSTIYSNTIRNLVNKNMHKIEKITKNLQPMQMTA